MKIQIAKLLVCGMSIVLLSSSYSIVVSAQAKKQAVAGKQYVFKDADSNYDYSSSKGVPTSTSNTIGLFTVTGNLKSDGSKGTFNSYDIKEGTVDFSYSFNSKKYGTEEDEWHLIEDDAEIVNKIDLGDDILYGALILQTSLDGEHWIEDTVILNAFSQDTDLSKPFYRTNNFQLVNGCHYRVMIAYEIAKRTEDPSFGFDKYAYEKHLEVYEFFLHDSNADKQATPMENSIKKPIEMGELTKVETDSGYSKRLEMDVDDPHYGYDKKMGRFYISGYTSDEKDSNGNIVFMKKPGDKVTLWYVLEQKDLNKLWNNEDLSIAMDENGYDKSFGIQNDVNFKRGALIIKVKNKETSYIVPPYTDYLAACATTTANTKVELFEEGDYEVALDYEIVEKGIINTSTDYRVSFKFSIRNANAMAYPKDIKTRSTLENKSYSPYGFWIDFANSKYIHVYVEQKVLRETAGGHAESTGYNGPASDTDRFESPGIYTITITNEYTNRETTKIIYVGDLYYKALAINDMSPKDLDNEINNNGAEINVMGTLDYPQQEIEQNTPPETTIDETEDPEGGELDVTSQNTTQETVLPEETANNTGNTAESVVTDENKDESTEFVEIEFPSTGMIISFVSVVLLIVFVCARRKRKQADKRRENNK